MVGITNEWRTAESLFSRGFIKRILNVFKSVYRLK